MNRRNPLPRTLRRCASALSIVFAAILFTAVFGAVSASAAFGVKEFDVAFTNKDGTPATQAGSHPYAMTTITGLNYTEVGPFEYRNEGGQMKNLDIEQVAGFVGSATAMPTCSKSDFVNLTEGAASYSHCPDSTAVGMSATNVFAPAPVFYVNSPVYNVEPPNGYAAELGFIVLGIPILIDVGVKQGGEYNLTASSINTPQAISLFGATVQLWGNPPDPSHDSLRGECSIKQAKDAGAYSFTFEEFNFGSSAEGSCPANTPEKAFITLPTSCTGPALTAYAADSWEAPGVLDTGTALTHDNGDPPNPQGFTGCGKLGFAPTIKSQPTTNQAETPTGLDFSLNVKDEGLEAPDGLAKSNIKKAVVRLPQGMSINPSVAEGLGVCTPADYERETLNADPGAGCPNSSKIGTVEVETPLVRETIKGSLFIAQQNQNPFNSLLAMYIVFKSPKLGVIVKQAAKVVPDERTGQLTTIVDGIPQIPFSHFRLHFREGGRSPLASPAACGTYTAEADLTPWSDPTSSITATSSFTIISGTAGGPCPTDGTPPFHPGLDAGAINNAAGQYSPFNVRLTRNDGEQEFTNFSIKLPPGIVGKLAGIPFCPDAAIAAAKSRTGTAEEQSPSCPKASEVGHTLVGAGVGSSLTYAPGKVYLAGPYNGSSLSIAAITAAKVGPFDVGTVVVREALKINPETAEVFVDPTGSDPIPHIIKGIVVHARDIRVYIDKPEFVLNPTNCERTSTASTLLGSGLDFASTADDQPITVTSPFQAASCASLGFGPKLELSLKGATKRGGTPAFKAVLTARKGDANIGEAQVTLPHSEFLEQAHIKTICTRAQFKAGTVPGEKCPPASVYGYAKAITPLLDEPIEGPVFLRSSSHNLPDLVAALHSGKIDINLVGRIDSVGNGQIRNTFEEVPDAPVTRFTLNMQGGKKGLLVNSTNLCKRTNRATADFTGQNGKKHVFNPVLKPLGCKAKAKKQKRAR